MIRDKSETPCFRRFVEIKKLVDSEKPPSRIGAVKLWHLQLQEVENQCVKVLIIVVDSRENVGFRHGQLSTNAPIVTTLKIKKNNNIIILSSKLNS